jgi:hypothetical protein
MNGSVRLLRSVWTVHSTSRSIVRVRASRRKVRLSCTPCAISNRARSPTVGRRQSCSGVDGAPAWMKLITTFPLGRYDILPSSLRIPPCVSENCQGCYDSLLRRAHFFRLCGDDEGRSDVSHKVNACNDHRKAQRLLIRVAATPARSATYSALRSAEGELNTLRIEEF